MEPETSEVATPPARIEPASAVVSVMPEAAKPMRKVRREGSRRMAASPPPAAELSLVQVTGVDQTLVPGIRAAVERRFGVLRTCCEDVMRTVAVKGEIVARVSVGAGRVMAIDIGSTSRSTELRWCFRKELMGLEVAATGNFDARLEFFVVPRSRVGSP